MRTRSAWVLASTSYLRVALGAQHVVEERGPRLGTGVHAAAWGSAGDPDELGPGYDRVERHLAARMRRDPGDEAAHDLRAGWCPDPPPLLTCRGCGRAVDGDELVAARHLLRCLAASDGAAATGPHADRIALAHAALAWARGVVAAAPPLDDYAIDTYAPTGPRRHLSGAAKIGRCSEAELRRRARDKAAARQVARGKSRRIARDEARRAQNDAVVADATGWGFEEP